MFYIPTKSADCWKQFLAEPEKQWQTGFSARTFAHCWEDSRAVPAEIRNLFQAPVQLLIGLPEHKTPLPGGTRETQTDLLALLRVGERTCMAAVEGKVDEELGPTVDKWLVDASAGKRTRLEYIRILLGLDTIPGAVRYQLLHRTAAAVIESERFKTDEAAMIVHSFSPTTAWLEDFRTFVALFGQPAEPDQLHSVVLPTGKILHLAWARGDQQYLSR